MRLWGRGRIALAVDASLVALVASSSVVIERLRGLDHAGGDLLQMFIPSFAWWWSRPRWLGGWNPWVFAGFPANADPLVGHVHPLGLVWAMVSPLAAAAIEGALAPTLAGLGMLVYLKSIGCGRLGSLVGALSFAGSGFVHAHAVHPEKLRSVLAIPWALAALERLQGPGLVAGLGAAVAVLVAGGHPQTILLALTLIAAYALWLGHCRGRRGIAIATGIGLGGLVPMVTWLPAIDLILRTSHAETVIAGVSRFIGKCMSTLVVPFACGGGSGPIYGRSVETFPGCGLIDCTGYPGMVVVLAVVAGGHRLLADTRGRFWIVAGAIGLALSTGFTEQLVSIPGLRAPARGLLWWSLATAVAAGLVLRPPLAGRAATIPSPRAWMGAAAFLALVIAAAASMGPVASRAAVGSLAVLVVSTAAAIVGARRGWAKGGSLLVLVLAADLVTLGAAMHAGMPPRALTGLQREFADIRDALPATPDGEASLGRVVVAPLMLGAAWAPLEGVRSLQGWNVLVPRTLSRLLGTDEPGRYEFALLTDPTLLHPSNAALDLLRVRLLVVSSALANAPPWRAALANPRWAHAGGNAKWQFYSNAQALPVAWLVHQARAVSEDEALAVVHGQRGPFAPATEALTTDAIDGLEPQSPTEYVDLVEYDDDFLRLSVQSGTNALLVTSELAHPGWHALVDGQATAVRAVDGGLRAVLVPSGSHVVELRYRPLLGRIGLWLGGASFLVLLGCAARAMRRHS